jgi:hypothetical protein
MGVDLKAGKKARPDGAFLSSKRRLPAQAAPLSARNGKDALRNPAVIYLRFAMYFALCSIITVAQRNAPVSVDKIQVFLGALCFANAFLVFMSNSVVPVYINERGNCRAEAAQRLVQRGCVRDGAYGCLGEHALCFITRG